MSLFEKRTTLKFTEYVRITIKSTFFKIFLLKKVKIMNSEENSKRKSPNQMEKVNLSPNATNE